MRMSVPWVERPGVDGVDASPRSHGLPSRGTASSFHRGGVTNCASPMQDRSTSPRAGTVTGPGEQAGAKVVRDCPGGPVGLTEAGAVLLRPAAAPPEFLALEPGYATYPVIATAATKSTTRTATILPRRCFDPSWF